MERIKLTTRSKKILKQAAKHKYQITKEDNAALQELEYYGLMHTNKLIGDTIWNCSISEKGKTYVKLNPKLSNPSIWDDKKYKITTGIAIITLLISAISLFKEQIIQLWNK